MPSKTLEQKPDGASQPALFPEILAFVKAWAEVSEEPHGLLVDANASLQSQTRKSPRNATPYLITVKEAAERLQLGINCVYSLTKTEHDPIPTVIIGRSIRIPVAGLERWIEAQTRG